MSAPRPDGIAIRPATAEELPACGRLWQEAIDDYLLPLNQPPVPDELEGIGKLHGHARATDPERFLVAVPEAGHDDAAPIAFGSALRRDGVWFLSMLFVRPGSQAAGLGTRLLEALLPRDDAALATATDSLQPISNALYARFGIVPRMPLLNLIGHVRQPAALPALPSGITVQRFEELVGSDGAGHRELADAVDTLDRDAAGFAHPQDHRWLRQVERQGFLYRGPDGTPVAYGYASPAGRLGPVAATDPALVVPVLGHLVDAVRARDAWNVWLPGGSGLAVTALLTAGLRLDGFPLLLCWSRPFADWDRYLPISPGLL